MKQKNNDSKLVTKTVLKAEIKNLEERLEKKFVTQGLFRYEIDKTKQEIDDKAQKYRDQVLTSNDKLARTLETMREELEIGSFQTRRKVDNHETRIKQLEKIQQIT